MMCKELTVNDCLTVIYCQFLTHHIGPPWPASSINLYITCFSNCTTRMLHMFKLGKPPSQKYGQGPVALKALPVPLLT